MNENYLDDVIPPVHKRTIRDIPIPAHRQRKHIRKSPDVVTRRRVERDIERDVESDIERDIEEDDFNSESENNPRKNNEMQNKGLNKLKFVYGPLVVLVLILVVYGMNLFSKAQVEILTKTESLANLNTNFSISTIEDLNGEKEIPYQKISLQKTSSLNVTASGEKFVEQKASGTVIIYNEYSSKPQTLVEKTRFESPSGKIYRIAKGVTVPGYNDKTGTIIPGKIEVEVFADESGEDFNDDLVDARLNIPGFKGQAQYDVFYANTKTPISGGFKGTKKIVSEEDMAEAKLKLESDVKELLQNEIASQLPKNLIAIYDESSFTFSALKQNDESSDGANLELSGNLTLVAFDKSTLAKKIAEDQLVDYRIGEEIEITNLDDLSISLNLKDERIAISGDVDFRWKNDLEKLKTDLAGASDELLRDIFTQYRGIVSVNTKISPFWKTEFPKNINKIDIIEK